MIKTLYIISLIALISAGVLFVACGMLWLRGVPHGKDNPEISIADKFRKIKSPDNKGNRVDTTPLVKQATTYALYLNPPKPPAPKQVPRPQQTVQKPVVITPKFRLLSTSYYRSNPDKSLALVSEPGKGDHWIQKDERLGHFIVESVKDGAIVYRDGNQSHEMKVIVQNAVNSAQIKSNVSASTRGVKPDLGLLDASKTSEVE